MYTIQVYYHDGEAYSLTEESEGLALANAEGISDHEIVDHVDVCRVVHADEAGHTVSAAVAQYIDGYELPAEAK